MYRGMDWRVEEIRVDLPAWESNLAFQPWSFEFNFSTRNWKSFTLLPLKATASVDAKSCKIEKVAHFTHFEQKNTHISGYKTVHIIILHFFSLTSLLSPSDFSLSLSLSLFLWTATAPPTTRQNLGFSIFFFQFHPPIPKSKPWKQFSLSKPKNTNVFTVFYSTATTTTIAVSTSNSVFSSGWTSILSPRKFSSRLSIYFFLIS